MIFVLFVHIFTSYFPIYSSVANYSLFNVDKQQILRMELPSGSNDYIVVISTMLCVFFGLLLLFIGCVTKKNTITQPDVTKSAKRRLKKYDNGDVYEGANSRLMTIPWVSVLSVLLICLFFFQVNGLMENVMDMVL